MNKTIYISFSLVIALAVVFYLLIKDGVQTGSLEVELPGGVKTEIKIKDNRVEFINLFDKLFSNEKKTRVTTALLEEKGFYTIDNNSLIDAIRNLSYDHPTAMKLRYLLHIETKGPFQEVSKKIRVKILPENETLISQGEAAICRSDDFFLSFVLLHNTKDFIPLGLKAIQNGPCYDSTNNTMPTEIFITQEDSNVLYNNKPKNEDGEVPIIAYTIHSPMRLPN